MNKATLIFGLITLSAFPLCYADDNVAISAKQMQSLGITTGPLPAKRIGESSGFPAQVIIPGGQLYIVSTPLPAMIEQTLVGVGDTVKKGQALAYLQSPALAEVQRGLLQASVQNQLAHENLARDETLYKDGIIAESRYRTTRSLALEAQATLSERKQMLRLSGMSDTAIAQLQSGSSLNSLLTITSPIDGSILEKTASAGQRLDAAVPLFKIAKLSPLALEIQAPLSFTQNLKVGAIVSVPSYSASGKLTAIGHSLTGSNQTLQLRATITQGTENLRAGQYVEATISTNTNSLPQWEIPNSSISYINGKSAIFVATPQGFRVQAIRIQNEGASNSVITGELKGDEKIAVRGVSALKSSVMGIGGGE
jgi:RND family efflux transporter MFP subunit